MKRNLKSIMAIILGGAMVLGASGCASNSSSNATVPASSSTNAGTQEASSEAVTLKFAHADSDTSVFNQGATAFKEKLEELSGGQVKVEIYGNGQLGTLSDYAQGIQMGTIDVAPVSATVLANFAPSISAFDLPFLIETEQQAYNALDGEVGTILASELEKNKMLCKGWWTLGYRNVTTSKEVKSIEDLNGLKIRTQNSEIHMKIFKALGVDATPMDFSELFTALQQGTVDGQENPYSNILNTNIFEVNNMLVDTGHVYQVAGLLFSPSTWDKLSSEQQTWVNEASAYATGIERTACTDNNNSAKESLINEHGMKFVELDKAQLQAATASVYDEYPDLKELADKVKSYK